MDLRVRRERQGSLEKWQGRLADQHFARVGRPRPKCAIALIPDLMIDSLGRQTAISYTHPTQLDKFSHCAVPSNPAIS